MRSPAYIIVGLVVVLSAGVSGLRVHAQPAPALDPDKALTQYVHHMWRAEHGLPQNTVGSILQTRDGYLWLGTEEGLVRFDGVRLVIFNKQNTPAFTRGHAIETLYEDTDGVLWIGTARAGLVRYSGNSFTRYTREDGLTGQEVAALLQDDGGNLWVGTRDAGLFILREGRFESRFEEVFTTDHVSALYQDRTGVLWVGTHDGLHRVAGSDVTVYRYADGTDSFVMALHEDRSGTLWVGTRAGLSRFVDGTLVPYATAEGVLHTAIRALWEDAAGTLWMGMEGGGLGRLRGERFDTFTSEDGLTHDWVLALYGDQEGSLWIGTEAGGLNQLRNGKFTAYSSREGLSHDIATAVYGDQEGSLWIGTDGGGLNHLRDGTVSVYTTAEGLSGNIITSLSSDGDGSLWIGTLRAGLNHLRDGRVSVYTVADGLLSNHIYALYTGADSSLWIGTDAGLSRLRDGRIMHVTMADGLPSNLVTVLLEDREGALWIGTYDGGLARFHEGRFTRYTAAEGLGSDLVLALHEDAAGVIWVGTYEGGMSRIQDGTLTTYTTRDGLFNDTVYAILEDDQGRLWMSCNKGLFTISKAALNRFAGGRRDRLDVTVYARADGLRNPEMNGGAQPAGWKLRDGTLWFPTLEGVAGIDPQQIQHNALPPPLAVEQILADNVPVPLQKEIALDPGTKRIDFRYTALSFIASENIRFRFFLEGYDTEWQDAGTDRNATYTNLSPGIYTFRVMARNSDGVWNESGTTVSFNLRPYFYQTLWFVVLCLLAGFLLAFAVYRWRVRRLKDRERELQALVDVRTEDLRTAKEQIEQQAERLFELDRFKTRFFANVSHEFRTPLTMIVGPLENALHGGYGSLDDPLRRQVEIMLRNALRLMRLINQLLDLSKLEAGKMQLRARPRDLMTFIEGVVLSFTAFAEQKGIDLTFHTTREDLFIFFEPDKLEKVFFNLLSNAVKFTPAQGEVIVEVEEQPPDADMPEGSVLLCVRDTGPGIPEEELPHIFDRFRQVDDSNTREHEGTGIGLALVKELVLLHHGTIKVKSKVGEGTTFAVILPKGDSHLVQEEVTEEASDEDYVQPEQGAMTELAFSALGFMPEGEQVPANGHPAEDGSEGMLVLVVEDNADVREYVGSILGAQYRVVTAQDGEEGLERARTLQPDLIISDVMMPKMDGNELCRVLKKDPDLSTIPIVLLTARATQQTKIEGLEVGADDYLAKPFNARELLARAHNLLRMRQQEKELKQLNLTLEQKVEEQVKTILDERFHYEQQLLEAKEQVESSLRLKTAILDNLNHEFRTPLTIIQGYAQILAKEVPTGMQEFADHIDRSGERLMKTLEAVHQLSRLEANGLEMTAVPLNLNMEVQEAQRRFSEEAARKGLRLRLDVPGDAPVFATLDAEAVQRVLDHLLDNALKFTDEGEVLLQVKRSASEAVLCVKDTGIGIDENFLPHLFDAFTQESSGLTRTHAGIGLGLTVAHRLVERLGGTIDVESRKGQGSTFTVRFRVIDSPPEVTRALPKPHRQHADPTV